MPAQGELTKASKKLWYSWAEAEARIVEVCGRVNMRSIRNSANRPRTFLTGRNKKGGKAPFPRMYPVDAETFEQWLYGKTP